MAEDFWMRRLMGMNGFGSGELWLAVAYLVCLFGVLLFRPQQISSPFLFRLSYILFAVSLILPNFVDAIVQMTMLDRDGMRSARGGAAASIGLMVVSPLFAMIGRVLFGVSLICGFGALRAHGNEGPSRPRHIPAADE